MPTVVVIPTNSSAPQLRDFLTARQPDTLLRKLLSPFWGESVGGKKCLWTESKESHLAYHKRKGYWKHTKRAKLLSHFGGTATVFGMNWTDDTSPETVFVLNGSRFLLFIAMIDIDCHVNGSRQGAEAARNAIDAHVPGVWWEPSTSGVGLHGYCGVLLPQNDAIPVATFDNLETAVRKIVKHAGADVTGVEVKGRPATVKYERHGYSTWEMTLRGGDHFKLPRQIVHRFGEFLDMHIFCPQEVRSVLQAVSTHTTISSPAPEAPHYRDGAGSTDLLTPELVARAMDRLPRVREYVESLKLTAQRVRNRVIDDEVYAGVLLCRLVTPTKKDGSMSVRRIGLVWDALYEEGLIAKRFNPSAFAVARNTLTDANCIDWLEVEYWFPHNYGGQAIKGRACRWRINLEVEDTLNSKFSTLISSGGGSADNRFNPNIGKRPMLSLHEGRKAISWYVEAEKKLLETAMAVKWHELESYQWHRAA